jgi:hypothetical protein
MGLWGVGARAVPLAMKKTFALHAEGQHPDRRLEAIKHEIRKYLAQADHFYLELLARPAQRPPRPQADDGVPPTAAPYLGD